MGYANEEESDDSKKGLPQVVQLVDTRQLTVVLVSRIILELVWKGVPTLS